MRLSRRGTLRLHDVARDHRTFKLVFVLPGPNQPRARLFEAVRQTALERSHELSKQGIVEVAMWSVLERYVEEKGLKPTQIQAA